MHATLCQDTTALPKATPSRSWRRHALLSGIAALLAWTLWQIAWLYLLGNVHVVIPGKLYRGAQPSAESLERLIDRYQIRTVLNVRGCCYPDDWYRAEAEVCERRGIHLEDVCFSAVHLPSRDEMCALIEVLDRAETPIFVHCRQGADRTGIASMSAQLLLEDETFESARRQLSWRYGHAPIGKTTTLDQFIQLYADWLKKTGQEHAPKHFRSWVLEEYRGGPCDARFEKVERLFEKPRLGMAMEYNVVVRNTSLIPWQFRPTKFAGHHVTFKVVDPTLKIIYEGRGGMFNRVVAPGEKVNVIIRVPPIAEPGHYRLFIDMIEEGHCWFHQTGSELHEEEFELRE